MKVLDLGDNAGRTTRFLAPKRAEYIIPNKW